MKQRTNEPSQPSRRRFLTQTLAAAGAVATTVTIGPESIHTAQAYSQCPKAQATCPQLLWKKPSMGAAPSRRGAIEIPELDPALKPREEAMFFLHVAASIEHSLMLQYLYAAYSLKSAADVLSETGDPEKSQQVTRWSNGLLQIAREEMGHLLTAENLLALLGGPLNFGREDFPYRSDLYPFPFQLEPLTKDSLAKYVVGEQPLEPPVDIDDIVERARRAEGVEGVPLHRVGALYRRLKQLFSQFSDADVVSEPQRRQALGADWRATDRILVPPVTTVAEAVSAIEQISEQGEGPEKTGELPSHFDRFLAMYKEFPEDEWQPARRVPRNPVIASEDDPGATENSITHPRSRKWAHLFNFRYQMLLAYLAHFMALEGPTRDTSGLTARGHLVRWTFYEMIQGVARIGGKLTTLPRQVGSPAGEVAAPTFQLPYTLSLSNWDTDRWRLDVDVVDASTDLINKIMKEHSEDADNPLLRNLLNQNRVLRAEMLRRSKG